MIALPQPAEIAMLDNIELGSLCAAWRIRWSYRHRAARGVLNALEAQRARRRREMFATGIDAVRSSSLPSR
jgi:hypothetical protein